MTTAVKQLIDSLIEGCRSFVTQNY